MTREQKNNYIGKKYGRNLAWYEAHCTKGCQICGSLPVTRSLPIDHSHALRLLKIKSEKVGKKQWRAWIPDLPKTAVVGGTTKPKALAEAREILKFLSARGVICFSCNGGLRKFRDNPLFLRKAAEYLERYQKELSGTN